MKSSRFLIIETSGHGGHVALAEDTNLVAVQQLREARRHARDLAPFVKQLLAERDWKPKDVQAVFVGRGPGSYTGLRVGMISARTFAYVTGCEVLVIDTFAVFAEQTPESVDQIDVLSNAQKEMVYVQGFSRDKARNWQERTPLQIVPYSQWLENRAEEVWVGGSWLTNGEARLPGGLPRVTPEFRTPHPSSMLAVGLRRWQLGERDDPWTIEPLYLRPSAAEEQWEQRQSTG